MTKSPGYFEVHFSGTAGQEGDARLEWIEGVPVLTNLSPGAGQVRVNAVPLAAGVPYFIQPGDRISLGENSLTWSAGADSLQPAEAPARPAAPQPSQPPPVKPESRVPESIRLVISTPQGSKEYPLTGEIIRLGRAVDNDISIDDKMVSRYHAQMLRKGDTYEIIDLGSINGLTFQNARFTKRLLANGDVIGISRSITLTFQTPGAAPDLPAAAPDKQAPPATIVAPQMAAFQPSATPVIPVAAFEEEAPPQTVVMPPQVTASPSETPVVPAAASEKQPPPETIVAPHKAAAPPSPPSPEPAAPETVVVPKKSVEPPPASATIIAPKKALESPASTQPEKAAGPVVPQASSETVVAAIKPTALPQPAEAAPPAAVPGPQDSPPTVISPLKPAEPPPADLGETAAVDMAGLVSMAFDQQFIPALTPRDTSVPYLIVHLPDRTWDVDFTKEQMTIGRGDDSDIQIQDESISRRHASIERRGDGFILRDQQSRNGIWLGKQRVDQHRLRDGDVISLGRAKLIFKGGFRTDDLTLIGSPRIDGRPARRPVVFVPGFGGSELWLGSDKIWPVPKIMISNPEILRLPGDPRVEARGIVSDVVIIPGIMKQEQYSRLGDYLESNLGYKRGRDLLEFAYDWRQDIRSNSQRLAKTIEAWQIRSPITIIAHSLGTLVSRYYVEKFGGKDKVERLVLMGGPHYGTPRGLAIITVGPGVLPFGFGDERMRKVLNTMPSSYQILPIYPCVFDQHNQHIDLLEDESWLPEGQRHFLGETRSFRKELGFQSSVPAVSIFGYGLKTVLRVKVIRRPDGSWQKIEPIDELGGDLTVPAGSSVLQNSEIHPVMQEHGSLYVDNDVKMRLKVELTRSTTLQRRK